MLIFFFNYMGNGRQSVITILLEYDHDNSLPAKEMIP